MQLEENSLNWAAFSSVATFCYGIIQSLFLDYSTPVTRLVNRLVYTPMSAAFHVGAETPEPKTRCILGHLKCTNHPGYEVQSFSTQKVGYSKWRPFFDSMHFRPQPLPSGGFVQKVSNGQGFHLTRVN